MRINDLIMITTLLFGILTIGPLSASEGVKAYYQVPVSEDLKEAALFPLYDIKIQNVPVAEIRYSLPRELTGENISIRITQVGQENGLVLYSGEFAEAKCDIKECHLRYLNLTINEDARTQFIEKVAKSPAHAQKLKTIADIFSNDPIGIVLFEQ